MKTALLLSGGLDSVATGIELDRRRVKFRAVYVDCGTEYSQVEKETVRKICIRRGWDLIEKSIPIGDFQVGKAGYIPHRNWYLAMIAAAAVQASPEDDVEVYLGGLKDDEVEDKSPEAFRTMTTSLTFTSRSKVEVKSLFWDKTKMEVVEHLIEKLGMLPATKVLEGTVSCYKGTKCGDCPSCFRAAVAIAGAGIYCVDWYLENPFKSGTAEEYFQKMSSPSHYCQDRVDATLRVLKEWREE